MATKLFASHRLDAALGFVARRPGRHSGSVPSVSSGSRNPTYTSRLAGEKVNWMGLGDGRAWSARVEEGDGRWRAVGGGIHGRSHGESPHLHRTVVLRSAPRSSIRGRAGRVREVSGTWRGTGRRRQGESSLEPCSTLSEEVGWEEERSGHGGGACRGRERREVGFLFSFPSATICRTAVRRGFGLLKREKKVPNGH
jgi:hypothetical protein